MTSHQEHHSSAQPAMARTWFPGHPTAPNAPPSRGAVSKARNPAPSNEDELSKNKVAVRDSATPHPITPTKATRSDTEPYGPEISTTPSSSRQKEPDTQPTKGASDHPLGLPIVVQKLDQQLSKEREQRRAATQMSNESVAFKPATAMDGHVPSPSAPRRAPTAQMVGLPPSAAVTAAPAAITSPAASTEFPHGPCQSASAMGASNTQACNHVTAPGSLPVSLNSSSPSSAIASSEKCLPKKSTPKAPKITLTPAPATAPNAFRDTAFVPGVQNTKLLSPVKQQTNGIQKRKYTKRSKPDLPSTPDSVPEEKRGPGRPRTTSTRVEEQSLEQKTQHRPPVQPATSLNNGTAVPNQPSSSSPAGPSALPTQQQQPATLRSNHVSNPLLCSEDPRLWPGRGDYVSSLQNFDSTPSAIHSEPVRACSNRAAHQDPAQGAHGHGVCTTCRNGAYRHLEGTRREKLGSAWWPLCNTCSSQASQASKSHTEPQRNGCSCATRWLCCSCLTEEVETRHARNTVEAESRRNLVGRGMDKDASTVITGWLCECGKAIGPGPRVMKCVGCQGTRIGAVNPKEEAAREKAFRKMAFKCT